ncbi:unnamed protein product [Didymodactylos carnosus]|uniref:Uncharacterized protein n=1 Tax=Didymodactylos carnosus TaxID=1234261 RepID=A0A814JLB4_9BILA|nr:unnamed protein product [Didymodactylos carnosus]CAF3807907.1 unnamed protein product [Didymodactylos carnosus]
MSPTGNRISKRNSQRQRKKSTTKRNCNKKKTVTNTRITLHVDQQQQTPGDIKCRSRISNNSKKDDIVYVELDTKCGCNNTDNSNVQFTKRYLECKKTMPINIYKAANNNDKGDDYTLLNDYDELKDISSSIQTSSYQLPHIQLKFTVVNLSTSFANCLCIQDNKIDFNNYLKTSSYQNTKQFLPTIIEHNKLSSILSTYISSSITPVVNNANAVISSPSIINEKKSLPLVPFIKSSNLSSSQKCLPSILTPPLSPTPSSSTKRSSIVSLQNSSLNILTPPSDREKDLKELQHSGFIIKDIEDLEDDHQWDVINEVARRFGEPINIHHENLLLEKKNRKQKKLKKSKSSSSKRMLPKILPKLLSHCSSSSSSSSSLSSIALSSPILSSSLSNSSFDDSRCPVDLSIKKRLSDENTNTSLTKYIKI